MELAIQPEAQKITNFESKIDHLNAYIRVLESQLHQQRQESQEQLNYIQEEAGPNEHDTGMMLSNLTVKTPERNI